MTIEQDAKTEEVGGAKEKKGRHTAANKMYDSSYSLYVHVYLKQNHDHQCGMGKY